MVKIAAIVLVGLLGFLGCSDGNDGTTTVGNAIPVAPFGIVEPPIHTYKWTPVSGATRYRLIVQETNREGTTVDTEGTNIIDKWHTAEEAGCASEESLCMVTPDIELHGEHEFKVQACANQECGEHSDPLPFHSTAMNGPRFTDNGDGTVTDNNTKLIWSKKPNVSDEKPWDEAMSYCDELVLASHRDWRLPSIHELMSLIDPHQVGPALPPGNPFTHVPTDGFYWTSTVDSGCAAMAYFVSMYNGYGGHDQKIDTYCYVWPVRSGN